MNKVWYKITTTSGFVVNKQLVWVRWSQIDCLKK